MTTSGHDDGDDERGDTGQPGKRKGVRSRRNRDARANNQYEPAMYLVLIWLCIR